MTRIINGLTDRMFGALFGTAEAGACIPENGQTYWTLGCGSCSCNPGQRWIRKDCEYRIGCTGASTLIATRCTTTQSIC